MRFAGFHLSWFTGSAATRSKLLPWLMVAGVLVTGDTGNRQPNQSLQLPGRPSLGGSWFARSAAFGGTLLAPVVSLLVWALLPAAARRPKRRSLHVLLKVRYPRCLSPTAPIWEEGYLCEES
jgi:hypothetical protein